MSPHISMLPAAPCGNLAPAPQPLRPKSTSLSSGTQRLLYLLMLLQKMVMSTRAGGECPVPTAPCGQQDLQEGPRYHSSPHLCGSGAPQDDYLSLPAQSPTPAGLGQTSATATCAPVLSSIKVLCNGRGGTPLSTPPPPDLSPAVFLTKTVKLVLSW